MIKSYLIIALRNIIKQKVFVFINTIGLGIAIACSIIAFLNWDFNNRFDKNHKNTETVYRVNSTLGNNGEIKIGTVPLPMASLISENIPEVKETVRYVSGSVNILVNDEFFPATLSYVDPNFFSVFTFDLIEGNYKELSDKSRIFIREDLATKYFGNESPIGKQIAQFLDKDTKEYIIAGVFKKQPENSSFNFIEALVNYDNYFDAQKIQSKDDWKIWNTTFILLKSSNDTKSVEAKIQKYVKPQNEAVDNNKIYNYYLEPFGSMAMNAQKFGVQNHWFRSSLPGAAILGPTILSVFMMLIACFNFTNTTIVMSGRRLKEIGIRKSIGGLRNQLVIQFFLESFILCLLAMAAGLLFSEFMVPAYNDMWQFVHLEVNYNSRFVYFILVLLVLISFGACSYPSLYISKYNPINILRGTVKFKGDNYLIRFLLTLQLSISIIAIIASIAFIKNAIYQRSMDYGFNTDGIIYASLEDSEDYEKYKNSLTGHPDIAEITGTKHHILTWIAKGMAESNGINKEVDLLETSPDYINIMNIKLLTGRNFNEDSENDRSEAIIVNETFLRTFNLKEPLGKRVLWDGTTQLYIIGIVKDFYSGAFKEPIRPLAFRLASNQEYAHIVVKAKEHRSKAAGEFMAIKWKEIFPNKFYRGSYMADNLAGPSKVNKNILSVFLFLGILTTLLSVAGLFNVVSFNILNKMKEVGVRKVFGGNLWDIALKINMKFIVLFFIASVLGSAAGFYLIDFLLDMIWTYHAPINFTTFMLATTILVFVSVLTISGKIMEIEKISPSSTLRSE
jgi:ABC-type antimicrobial peptide transport system permease subunit